MYEEVKKCKWLKRYFEVKNADHLQYSGTAQKTIKKDDKMILIRIRKWSFSKIVGKQKEKEKGLMYCMILRDSARR